MTTTLHPDRWNPCYSNQIRKLGVVVHDSESGDGSFVSLVNALRSPGNFWSDPNDHSKGKFGAGYHAVTNGVGGYLRVADTYCGPFSAPPANYTWAHVCMPGRAAQTREEWLDEISYQHIRGVARFIVDQWEIDEHTWPLNFVFADDLKNNKKGYTSHYQVSLAWRKSTHTDPGGNFPWDILEEEIYALIHTPPLPPQPQPQQEEEMPFTVKVKGKTAAYIRHTDGTLTWIRATDAPTVFARYGTPIEVSTFNDLSRLGVIIGENPGDV